MSASIWASTLPRGGPCDKYEGCTDELLAIKCCFAHPLCDGSESPPHIVTHRGLATANGEAEGEGNPICSSSFVRLIWINYSFMLLLNVPPSCWKNVMLQPNMQPHITRRVETVVWFNMEQKQYSAVMMQWHFWVLCLFWRNNLNFYNEKKEKKINNHQWLKVTKILLLKYLFLSSLLKYSTQAFPFSATLDFTRQFTLLV